MASFKTTNKKGEPLTCKFCHTKVWWEEIKGRWYDIGGETLHVDNCEARREHYKATAAEREEGKRQQKGGA